MVSQQKRAAALTISCRIAFLLIVMLCMSSPPARAQDLDAFISIWDTRQISQGSSESDQVSLPLLRSGDYDFIVDWGDGAQTWINRFDQEETTHTYAREGVYKITITGVIEGWSFFDGGDKLKILEINQWGKLNLGSSGGYFHGTKNLKITAEDELNLTGTTSMRFAFLGSGIDTVPGMDGWDMSAVIDMTCMFYEADLFNQNIGGWDVSSVRNMYAMFYRARTFNQAIGDWDVSSVRNMNWMLAEAESFNQDVGDWDVSNVEIMRELFTGASSFDQNIGNWNVSSVKDMRGMFYKTTSFNQNIGGWDVSNVTNMRRMFGGAGKFNHDISGWDVSIVTNMQEMFWNVIAFNQDIGNWDTSNVENMSGMFARASSFNQDIGRWNVGNVTDMSQMFYEARSFNHDIGGWNVSNVTDMSGMFAGASLSTENYDSLLIGWSQLPKLQRDVVFHAGIYTKYSENAADARAALVNDYGWKITDGGKAE